jgi:hypothetical protein
MPSYVYGGVTPIVLDDELKAGFISLVENGAFAFTQKNLANPLAYLDNPKGGNGAGSEEWGCKSQLGLNCACTSVLTHRNPYHRVEPLHQQPFELRSC